jgi:hypothetical protein
MHMRRVGHPYRAPAVRVRAPQAQHGLGHRAAHVVHCVHGRLAATSPLPAAKRIRGSETARQSYAGDVCGIDFARVVSDSLSFTIHTPPS